MDNDVQGTEYCIGFSTAITRAKEAINRQRTTLGQPRADRRLPDLRARRRVLRAVHGVRDVGALRHPRGAVRPRRAGRAPRRRPRREPQPLRLRHHGRGRDLEGRPDDRRRRAPTPSAIGTRPTSARRWRSSCATRTGIETLASELTYDLRSGEPDSIDSMVATTFANVAMDLVESGRHRADGRDPGRQVRPHGTPRPGARAAQGGRRRRCTTSSGSGRATTASWATRCCWSASTEPGRGQSSRPRGRGSSGRGPTCRRRRGCWR